MCIRDSLLAERVVCNAEEKVSREGEWSNPPDGNWRWNPKEGRSDVYKRQTWDLSFHLEYDTSTLSLPTGQTFHHGPLTGTVEEIRLSPISRCV